MAAGNQGCVGTRVKTQQKTTLPNGEEIDLNSKIH